MFVYKFRFAVEKKIFWDKFNLAWKKFVVAIKKASHTCFMYGSCMITIFFQKKRNVVFFITRLFYLVQIAAETSSNLFSMIFRKCMKFV